MKNNLKTKTRGRDKVLIIGAHPDDEIWGVGGTILKHRAGGDEIGILILGDGETARDTGANIQKRRKQAQTVAKALGAKKVVLENLPDNKFDSVPLLDVIKLVEKAIFEMKPSIIYTHCPFDLNVDHQIVFRAVLTACRPQPGFFVKKISTFETLSSTEWQVKKQRIMFCPNEYNDISKYVNKKAEILKIYKDELRKYPHPRSIKGMKALSRYRGMEAGLEFAEAFETIRQIH